MLDNAVWHALTTRHAHFAEAVGRARRYRTDVSVFCGVEEFDEGAWDDLTSLVGREGSGFLFRGWAAAPPNGWTVQMEGTGHQMVLEELRPVDVPPVRRLEAADVPQMLELVAIAQPGPFRPRTIELGDYYGVFDDGRLVAMAGERLRLPGLTEVSAVCTHPDARRRGLASGLSARRGGHPRSRRAPVPPPHGRQPRRAARLREPRLRVPDGRHVHRGSTTGALALTARPTSRPATPG